ncbi:MAG: EI24 domain-containing protein [Paracoccus sp. (in: a-proteobacteria)]
MIAAQAFLRGWADMLRPSIFGLVLRGIALTVALFIALQIGIFWAARSLMPGGFSLPYIGEISFGSALSWGSLALFPVMGFFLMAPVAAAFSGLYAEQVAERIEDIHYPDRRGREGDFWDGLLESLAVMGAVLLVGIICLFAAMVIGPLAPVLFFAANGWLLGREFFQMAASRHLPGPEATALRQRYSLAATALGTMIAVALSVPILNIAVPVLAAASFTHLYHLTRAATDPRS